MKVELCLFFTEPESDDAHNEGAAVTHQNVRTLNSRYRLAVYKKSGRNAKRCAPGKNHSESVQPSDV